MQSIFKERGALPATHQTYVERTDDRKALDAIRNGEYVYIMAPRQMGKTSLLNRLLHQLQSENLQSVYVDLAELTGFHKVAWYGELGKLLAEKLRPDQVPDLSNQLDLRRYLLDIISLKGSKTSYLALFLDEVEGVCSARDADGRLFSNDFFSVLRSIYNQRGTYPGVLAVVMAGANDSNALVANPAISPFNVCSEIILDDFAQSETYALTSYLNALGLSIHEDVPELIWNWTGGHPCLTQCICRELEDETRTGMLSAVTPETVAHVIARRFLNPSNALGDSALRSLGEKLNNLSAPAARLWSRLQAGEVVSQRETNRELYLELFLTGAVKSKGDSLVIRNQIYQYVFAKTDNKGRIHNLGGESSGILTNLYSQLRTVLLDCGSFATDRELKVIFVDKRLSPWRNRLPQADNPSGRVESVIDFLHNQYNDVEENVLVLLLRVLSERLDPGDACHQRLADLASEFEREVKSRNRARFESVEQVVPQDLDAPNPAKIRNLLNTAFDDPGLDAFCQGYFPAVFDRFGRGMQKVEKLTLLLDHCRIPDGFEKLLTAVRNDYDMNTSRQDELRPLLLELEQLFPQ